MHTDTPPLLEVEALSRRFGGLLAVDGLSLEVGEGEIFGLIEPNGAGKSTTFNLISGFIRPSAGRVVIDGRDLTGAVPWPSAGPASCGPSSTAATCGR